MDAYRDFYLYYCSKVAVLPLYVILDSPSMDIVSLAVANIGNCGIDRDILLHGCVDVLKDTQKIQYNKQLWIRQLVGKLNSLEYNKDYMLQSIIAVENVINVLHQLFISHNLYIDSRLLVYRFENDHMSSGFILKRIETYEDFCDEFAELLSIESEDH